MSINVLQYTVTDVDGKYESKQEKKLAIVTPSFLSQNGIAGKACGSVKNAFDDNIRAIFSYQYRQRICTKRFVINNKCSHKLKDLVQ